MPFTTTYIEAEKQTQTFLALHPDKIVILLLFVFIFFPFVSFSQDIQITPVVIENFGEYLGCEISNDDSAVRLSNFSSSTKIL